MAFTKYATSEYADVLDVKGSSDRIYTASLDKVAEYQDFRTDDNYLYVRIRAISSRVNMNHDGWPTVELAGSPEILSKHQSSDGFTVEASSGNPKYGFATFMNKPIFVDHNNGDPKKTRGVIVDAKFNVLSKKDAKLDPYWSSRDVDPQHLPACEVELLLEIDAKNYPKFASAVKKGHIDGFSMGCNCFLPGTQITLEDGTKKNIEDIEIDDLIVTHTGQIEPVTHLFKNPYEGVIYEVETYGQADYLQMTPEHPVWIKRIPSRYRERSGSFATECRCGKTFSSRRSFSAHLREVNRHNIPGEHSRDASETIEWIEAKDLQVGDYVLQPSLLTAGHPGSFAFARLLGYYLSEGNVGYDKKRYEDGRPVFVEWNFHEDEIEYYQEVLMMLDILGYKGVGPYVKNHCATVRCNSSELAQRFLDYGGKHSHSKKLSSEVLGWSNDNLKAVLTTYFNGDGTQNLETTRVATTASKRLAEQLQLIATKVGIRITPPIKQMSPVMVTNDNLPRYVLSTPSLERDPDGRSNHNAHTDSSGLWRRITNIRLKEYEGNVYNFDVEGDSSYIANDIAVHNCEFSICSHCGNKASSAGEFCSHVKLKGVEHDYKTASGERIKKKSYENVGGVQFFELSGVFNPADETALTKEVIASMKETSEFYDHNGQPSQPPYDDVNQILDQTGLNYGADGVTNGTSEITGMPVYKNLEHDILNRPEFMTDQNSLVDRNGLPIGAQSPVRPTPPNGVYDQAEHGGTTVLPNQPVMNDPRWSHVHVAENELPQSMRVHAPESLDTLRDEHVCPICGADMSKDETCEICGFTEPPKEFDNPDLNKAKQIREEMKAMEEAQAGPQAQPGPQASPGQGAPNQQMPNNSPTTASVNSRMSWTPLVTEKTAAKINKVEVPVLQPTTIVTNQPSNQTVISDQKSPVTSAMRTAQHLMATAQHNHIGESMSNKRVADGATPPDGTSSKGRVDVVGVGGFDEASNEAASVAQKQIDVNGVGGTGVEGVEPDHTESLPTADVKGNDSGFNTDKTTDDSGPTATFGDSDGSHSGVTDPVTSDPFPASEDGVKAANAYYAAVKRAQDEYATARVSYDDSTLEKNEQQGNDAASTNKHVKGTEPSDPIGKAQDRINPADPATSTKNNSGKTDTWHGTNGNGVTKQQDPVTKDKMEFGGVPTPDVQLHTGSVRISSIKLAELEIDLGLTPSDEKYNRIAELDSNPESVVQAKIETLSQVKTAGVAKLAHARTAGVTKLPSLFGKATAAPNGFARIASDHQTHESPIDDSGLDSAIFVR